MELELVADTWFLEISNAASGPGVWLRRARAELLEDDHGPQPAKLALESSGTTGLRRDQALALHSAQIVIDTRRALLELATRMARALVERADSPTLETIDYTGWLQMPDSPHAAHHVALRGRDASGAYWWALWALGLKVEGTRLSVDIERTWSLGAHPPEPELMLGWLQASLPRSWRSRSSGPAHRCVLALDRICLGLAFADAGRKLPDTRGLRVWVDAEGSEAAHRGHFVLHMAVDPTGEEQRSPTALAGAEEPVRSTLFAPLSHLARSDTDAPALHAAVERSCAKFPRDHPVVPALWAWLADWSRWRHKDTYVAASKAQNSAAGPEMQASLDLARIESAARPPTVPHGRSLAQLGAARSQRRERGLRATHKALRCRHARTVDARPPTPITDASGPPPDWLAELCDLQLCLAESCPECPPEAAIAFACAVQRQLVAESDPPIPASLAGPLATRAWFVICLARLQLSGSDGRELDPLFTTTVHQATHAIVDQGRAFDLVTLLTRVALRREAHASVRWLIELRLERYDDRFSEHDDIELGELAGHLVELDCPDTTLTALEIWCGHELVPRALDTRPPAPRESATRKASIELRQSLLARRLLASNDDESQEVALRLARLVELVLTAESHIIPELLSALNTVGEAVWRALPARAIDVALSSEREPALEPGLELQLRLRAAALALHGRDRVHARELLEPALQPRLADRLRGARLGTAGAPDCRRATSALVEAAAHAAEAGDVAALAWIDEWAPRFDARARGRVHLLLGLQAKGRATRKARFWQAADALDDPTPALRELTELLDDDDVPSWERFCSAAQRSTDPRLRARAELAAALAHERRGDDSGARKRHRRAWSLGIDQARTWQRWLHLERALPRADRHPLTFEHPPLAHPTHQPDPEPSPRRWTRCLQLFEQLRHARTPEAASKCAAELWLHGRHARPVFAGYPLDILLRLRDFPPRDTISWPLYVALTRLDDHNPARRVDHIRKALSEAPPEECLGLRRQLAGQLLDLGDVRAALKVWFPRHTERTRPVAGAPALASPQLDPDDVHLLIEAAAQGRIDLERHLRTQLDLRDRRALCAQLDAMTNAHGHSADTHRGERVLLSLSIFASIAWRSVDDFSRATKRIDAARAQLRRVIPAHGDLASYAASLRPGGTPSPEGTSGARAFETRVLANWSNPSDVAAWLAWADGLRAPPSHARGEQDDDHPLIHRWAAAFASASRDQANPALLPVARSLFRQRKAADLRSWLEAHRLEVLRPIPAGLSQPMDAATLQGIASELAELWDWSHAHLDDTQSQRRALMVSVLERAWRPRSPAQRYLDWHQLDRRITRMAGDDETAGHQADFFSELANFLPASRAREAGALALRSLERETPGRDTRRQLSALLRIFDALEDRSAAHRCWQRLTSSEQGSLSSLIDLIQNHLTTNDALLRANLSQKLNAALIARPESAQLHELVWTWTAPYSRAFEDPDDPLAACSEVLAFYGHAFRELSADLEGRAEVIVGGARQANAGAAGEFLNYFFTRADRSAELYEAVAARCSDAVGSRWLPQLLQSTAIDEQTPARWRALERTCVEAPIGLRVSIFVGLARMLAEHGDRSGGIEALEQALALAPNSQEIRLHLARMQTAAGQHRASINITRGLLGDDHPSAATRAALALNGLELADLWALHGENSAGIGEHELAAKALARARQRRRGACSELHVETEIAAWMACNQGSEAMQAALDQAMRHDDRQTRARWLLRAAELSPPQLATRWLRLASLSDPEQLDAATLWHQAAVQYDDPAMEREAREHLLELEPDGDTINFIADCLQHSEAANIESWTAIVARDAEHPEALTALATGHERRGHTDTAAHYWQRALQVLEAKDPRSLRPACALAARARANGDLEELAQWTSRALDAAPDDPELLADLLAIGRKSRDPSVILRATRGLVGQVRDPNEKFDLQRETALAHVELGEWDAAFEFFASAAHHTKVDRDRRIELCRSWLAAALEPAARATVADELGARSALRTCLGAEFEIDGLMRELDLLRKLLRHTSVAETIGKCLQTLVQARTAARAAEVADTSSEAEFAARALALLSALNGHIERCGPEGLRSATRALRAIDGVGELPRALEQAQASCAWSLACTAHDARDATTTQWALERSMGSGSEHESFDHDFAAMSEWAELELARRGPAVDQILAKLAEDPDDRATLAQLSNLHDGDHAAVADALVEFAWTPAVVYVRVELLERALDLVMATGQSDRVRGLGIVSLLAELDAPPSEGWDSLILELFDANDLGGIVELIGVLDRSLHGATQSADADADRYASDPEQAQLAEAEDNDNDNDAEKTPESAHAGRAELRRSLIERALTYFPADAEIHGAFVRVREDCARGAGLRDLQRLAHRHWLDAGTIEILVVAHLRALAIDEAFSALCTWLDEGHAHIHHAAALVEPFTLAGAWARAIEVFDRLLPTCLQWRILGERLEAARAPAPLRARVHRQVGELQLLEYHQPDRLQRACHAFAAAVQATPDDIGARLSWARALFDLERSGHQLTESASLSSLSARARDNRQGVLTVIAPLLECIGAGDESAARLGPASRRQLVDVAAPCILRTLHEHPDSEVPEHMLAAVRSLLDEVRALEGTDALELRRWADWAYDFSLVGGDHNRAASIARDMADRLPDGESLRWWRRVLEHTEDRERTIASLEALAVRPDDEQLATICAEEFLRDPEARTLYLDQLLHVCAMAARASHDRHRPTNVAIARLWRCHLAPRDDERPTFAEPADARASNPEERTAIATRACICVPEDDELGWRRFDALLAENDLVAAMQELELRQSASAPATTEDDPAEHAERSGRAAAQLCALAARDFAAHRKLDTCLAPSTGPQFESERDTRAVALPQLADPDATLIEWVTRLRTPVERTPDGARPSLVLALVRARVQSDDPEGVRRACEHFLGPTRTLSSPAWASIAPTLMAYEARARLEDDDPIGCLHTVESVLQEQGSTRDIRRRLLGSSWRIVLRDAATGASLHTLPSLPRATAVGAFTRIIASLKQAEAESSTADPLRTVLRCLACIREFAAIYGPTGAREQLVPMLAELWFELCEHLERVCPNAGSDDPRPGCCTSLGDLVLEMCSRCLDGPLSTGGSAGVPTRWHEFVAELAQRTHARLPATRSELWGNRLLYSVQAHWAWAAWACGDALSCVRAIENIRAAGAPDLSPFDALELRARAAAGDGDGLCRAWAADTSEKMGHHLWLQALLEAHRGQRSATAHALLDALSGQPPPLPRARTQALVELLIDTDGNEADRSPQPSPFQQLEADMGSADFGQFLRARIERCARVGDAVGLSWALLAADRRVSDSGEDDRGSREKRLRHLALALQWTPDSPQLHAAWEDCRRKAGLALNDASRVRALVGLAFAGGGDARLFAELMRGQLAAHPGEERELAHAWASTLAAHEVDAEVRLSCAQMLARADIGSTDAAAHILSTLDELPPRLDSLAALRRVIRATRGDARPGHRVHLGLHEKLANIAEALGHWEVALEQRIECAHRIADDPLADLEQVHNYESKALASFAQRPLARVAAGIAGIANRQLERYVHAWGRGARPLDLEWHDAVLALHDFRSAVAGRDIPGLSRVIHEARTRAARVLEAGSKRAFGLRALRAIFSAHSDDDARRRALETWSQSDPREFPAVGLAWLVGYGRMPELRCGPKQTTEFARGLIESRATTPLVRLTAVRTLLELDGVLQVGRSSVLPHPAGSNAEKTMIELAEATPRGDRRAIGAALRILQFAAGDGGELGHAEQEARAWNRARSRAPERFAALTQARLLCDPCDREALYFDALDRRRDDPSASGTLRAWTTLFELARAPRSRAASTPVARADSAAVGVAEVLADLASAGNVAMAPGDAEGTQPSGRRARQGQRWLEWARCMANVRGLRPAGQVQQRSLIDLDASTTDPLVDLPEHSLGSSSNDAELHAEFDLSLDLSRGHADRIVRWLRWSIARGHAHDCEQALRTLVACSVRCQARPRVLDALIALVERVHTDDDPQLLPLDGPLFEHIRAWLDPSRAEGLVHGTLAQSTWPAPARAALAFVVLRAGLTPADADLRLAAAIDRLRVEDPNPETGTPEIQGDPDDGGWLGLPPLELATVSCRWHATVTHSSDGPHSAFPLGPETRRALLNVHRRVLESAPAEPAAELLALTISGLELEPQQAERRPDLIEAWISRDGARTPLAAWPRLSAWLDDDTVLTQRSGLEQACSSLDEAIDATQAWALTPELRLDAWTLMLRGLERGHRALVDHMMARVMAPDASGTRRAASHFAQRIFARGSSLQRWALACRIVRNSPQQQQGSESPDHLEEVAWRHLSAIADRHGASLSQGFASRWGRSARKLALRTVVQRSLHRAQRGELGPCALDDALAAERRLGSEASSRARTLWHAHCLDLATLDADAHDTATLQRQRLVGMADALDQRALEGDEAARQARMALRSPLMWVHASTPDAHPQAQEDTDGAPGSDGDNVNEHTVDPTFAISAELDAHVRWLTHAGAGPLELRARLAEALANTLRDPQRATMLFSLAFACDPEGRQFPRALTSAQLLDECACTWLDGSIARLPTPPTARAALAEARGCVRACLAVHRLGGLGTARAVCDELTREHPESALVAHVRLWVARVEVDRGRAVDLGSCPPWPSEHRPTAVLELDPKLEFRGLERLPITSIIDHASEWLADGAAHAASTWLDRARGAYPDSPNLEAFALRFDGPWASQLRPESAGRVPPEGWDDGRPEGFAAAQLLERIPEMGRADELIEACAWQRRHAPHHSALAAAIYRRARALGQHSCAHDAVQGSAELLAEGSNSELSSCFELFAIRSWAECRGGDASLLSRMRRAISRSPRPRATLWCCHDVLATLPPCDLSALTRDDTSSEAGVTHAFESTTQAERETCARLLEAMWAHFGGDLESARTRWEHNTIFAEQTGHVQPTTLSGRPGDGERLLRRRLSSAAGGDTQDASLTRIQRAQTLLLGLEEPESAALVLLGATTSGEGKTPWPRAFSSEGAEDLIVPHIDLLLTCATLAEDNEIRRRCLVSVSIALDLEGPYDRALAYDLKPEHVLDWTRLALDQWAIGWTRAAVRRHNRLLSTLPPTLRIDRKRLSKALEFAMAEASAPKLPAQTGDARGRSDRVSRAFVARMAERLEMRTRADKSAANDTHADIIERARAVTAGRAEALRSLLRAAPSRRHEDAASRLERAANEGSGLRVLMQAPHELPGIERCFRQLASLLQRDRARHEAAPPALPLDAAQATLAAARALAQSLQGALPPTIGGEPTPELDVQLRAHGRSGGLEVWSAARPIIAVDPAELAKSPLDIRREFARAVATINCGAALRFDPEPWHEADLIELLQAWASPEDPETALRRWLDRRCPEPIRDENTRLWSGEALRIWKRLSSGSASVLRDLAAGIGSSATIVRAELERCRKAPGRLTRRLSNNIDAWGQFASGQLAAPAPTRDMTGTDGLEIEFEELADRLCHEDRICVRPRSA